MQQTSFLSNPQTRMRLLLLILGVVCIGAVISAALAARPNSPTNEAVRGDVEGDVRVLDADVLWTKQEFLVTNQSDLEWKECKLEVNAEGFGDGYGALLPQLPAGKRATIAHDAFRKADGTPYVYAAEAPGRFTIRCRDVVGKLGAYVGTPTER